MPESIDESPETKPRMINGKPIDSRKRNNNSVYEYGGRTNMMGENANQNILQLESCSSLNSS